MKFLAKLLLAAAVGVLVLGGCGKGSGSRPPNPKAFDSAAPEIKEMWTAAQEADRTNDYYRAEVILYELTRRDLPPDQLQAARDQIVLTQQRMLDGVSKGDPAAKASFDQFKMNPPNRPPPGAGQ